MSYPEPLQKLIDEFCRFPGIGPKTAQRLSFFLLSRPREEAAGLARAIVEAKDKLLFCSQCGCLTEKEPCRYCSDPRREQKPVSYTHLDVYKRQVQGGAGFACLRGPGYQPADQGAERKTANYCCHTRPLDGSSEKKNHLAAACGDSGAG